MAWACRGMSLKIVVRFLQYLSILLVLRPYGNKLIHDRVCLVVLRKKLHLASDD